jgi:hypothetical protein
MQHLFGFETHQESETFLNQTQKYWYILVENICSNHRFYFFLSFFSESRNRLGVKSIVEVRNAETNESRSTYEVDKIDGFHIWSFASDTDLGNFSTEQFSRIPSSKSTPNSSMKGIEFSYEGASNKKISCR